MEKLLDTYNSTLEQEGRDRIVPYLHKTIDELILIPSAKSICPSLDSLRSLPIVYHVHLFYLKAIIDRMCAESVLRGSDIFVKGIRSIEKNCVKGQRVCIVVDICNTDLPRGSDTSQFTGRNM